MALAWSCRAHPASHGPFLQHGLDKLELEAPHLQAPGRYACPICRANGEAGWVDPASQTDANRLFAQQEA